MIQTRPAQQHLRSVKEVLKKVEHFGEQWRLSVETASSAHCVDGDRATKRIKRLILYKHVSSTCRRLRTLTSSTQQISVSETTRPIVGCGRRSRQINDVSLVRLESLSPFYISSKT